MATKGSLYSKDLQLYAHGSTTTHSDLAAVKEKVKREGYVKGTVTPVASYWPVDESGKERGDLPLIWETTGEARPFEVTKRGAFRWADSMAVY